MRNTDETLIVGDVEYDVTREGLEELANNPEAKTAPIAQAFLDAIDDPEDEMTIREDGDGAAMAVAD